MTSYECEACGQTIEIEAIEATLYPPECYEHGRCQVCFDKDL